MGGKLLFSISLTPGPAGGWTGDGIVVGIGISIVFWG